MRVHVPFFRLLTLAISLAGPSKASGRRHAGVTRLLDAVRPQRCREEGDGSLATHSRDGSRDGRAVEPARGDVGLVLVSQAIIDYDEDARREEFKLRILRNGDFCTRSEFSASGECIAILQMQSVRV